MAVPGSDSRQVYDGSRQGKILEFHNALLDESDATDDTARWRLAGWSSPATQHVRFERLVRASRFAGGSILDWGCGTGDLYLYLQSIGHEYSYLGVDINSRMLAVAESRFGAHFRHVPISHQLSEEYDYVFASGIFQFRDESEPKYYLPMLRDMFAHARRAIAVNFLSTYRSAENKASSELYLDPAELLMEVHDLSTHWSIDHSYHPGAGDFTVAFLKPTDTAAWKRPDFESTTQHNRMTTDDGSNAILS